MKLRRSKGNQRLENLSCAAEEVRSAAKRIRATAETEQEENMASALDDHATGLDNIYTHLRLTLDNHHQDKRGIS